MTINIEPWMVAAICVMIAISTAVNVWHGIAVREYLNEKRKASSYD